MVTDSIENAATYMSLAPRIATALRFLSQPDRASVPLGRHELDGPHVFALVQEYSTKPPGECFWESHRKFIDAQFIASGVETIGWSPIGQMQETKPYDPERDLLVFQGTGQPLRLDAGSFAILWPHDVHMPCLAPDGLSGLVRKIVVKIAVD